MKDFIKEIKSIKQLNDPRIYMFCVGATLILTLAEQSMRHSYTLDLQVAKIFSCHLSPGGRRKI